MDAKKHRREMVMANNWVVTAFILVRTSQLKRCPLRHNVKRVFLPHSVAVKFPDLFRWQHVQKAYDSPRGPPVAVHIIGSGAIISTDFLVVNAIRPDVPLSVRFLGIEQVAGSSNRDMRISFVSESLQREKNLPCRKCIALASAVLISPAPVGSLARGQLSTDGAGAFRGFKSR